MADAYDATGPYVLVIPPAGPVPMEVVGIFGSFLKAEKWAVDHQLISWTACPVLPPATGDVLHRVPKEVPHGHHR
jgi:hypothetical protein